MQRFPKVNSVEEMGQSAWRPWARFMAIVEMVFSIIEMILTALLLFIIFGPTDPKFPEIVWIRNDSSGIFILFMFIVFAVIGLQIQAAYKLLKATRIGYQTVKANGKCRTWRAITIMLLILNIVGVLYIGISGTCVVTIWRITALYIVHKFMAEMDQASLPQKFAIELHQNLNTNMN